MNDRLRSAIENAIRAATGEPARLSESSSLSGGCIHSSRKLILEDGRIFFCKIGSGEPKHILEREFEGLRALGRADSIRTVKPLAHQSLPELGNQFLITEFVPPGKPESAFFERFGRGLARLHQDWTAPQFGFEHDNYIGRTHQSNRWTSDWCEFWGRHRLGFRLELAMHNGYNSPELQRLGRKLIDQLPEMIGAADEPPSLLHGDLWSGNFLVDEGGSAVLIDPAPYYGHREAELAMCQLFAGFSRAFYDSYRETWPLQAGAQERIEVYQLYHLLNHLNLFGTGYLGQCLDLLQRILG